MYRNHAIRRIVAEQKRLVNVNVENVARVCGGCAIGMARHPCGILVLHLTYNAVFGILDEVENFVDFRTHGNLFGNLDDSVLKAEITGVNDAVGIGNVTQNTLRHIDVLQNHGVYAVVRRRITA